MKQFILGLTLAATACGPLKKKTEVVVPPGVPQAPVEVPPPNIPLNPQFIDLPILEDSILLDLNTLSDVEQLNARYLNACPAYNQGARDMGERESASNKLLNSVSPLRRLGVVTPIPPADCVFRFDKRDFDITQGEWVRIEKARLLKYIPLSQRGQQIQFLTQTLVPYVLVRDLAVTVKGADALTHENWLYYDLINQPRDFAEFYRSIGADLQRQADNEELLVAARSQSNIALAKTRGMVLGESDDGFVAISHDSTLQDQQSHFEDPFIFEIAVAGGFLRTQKIYEEAAQETIYTLPNGMTAYRLSLGRDELNGIGGEAITFAGTEVVFNSLAAARQLDPVIYIGSCISCHMAPLIPFQDQGNPHIQRTAAFDALEKNLGTVYFDGVRIQGRINSINQIHQNVSRQIKVNNFNTDLVHDKFIFPLRAESNAEGVCSYLHIPLATCLDKIAGSLISSQQFGNILNGGTVSLATLSQNFEQLTLDTAAYDD